MLDEIIDRFQATLILAGAAILISFPLGIFIGLVSAVKQYSFVDRIFMLLGLVGYQRAGVLDRIGAGGGL